MSAAIVVRRYPPLTCHKDDPLAAPWCTCSFGEVTFDVPYALLRAAGMPPLARLRGEAAVVILTAEAPAGLQEARSCRT